MANYSRELATGVDRNLVIKKNGSASIKVSGGSIHYETDDKQTVVKKKNSDLSETFESYDGRVSGILNSWIEDGVKFGVVTED